jgi:hypothetical protein
MEIITTHHLSLGSLRDGPWQTQGRSFTAA